MQVIVHGGAGAWNRKEEKLPEALDACRQAAHEGQKLILQGASALDAVEAATRVLEDCPVLDAGRGSYVNQSGEIEMDALIMDGGTLNLGAVGGQTKPSTGYTFTRVQGYTQKLAWHLIQGFDPLPPQPSKFKYRYYDLLLLHILSNSTEDSLRVFRALFKKNSLDELFRFLGEDTHFRQDLKIMSSVPYIPFFKAIGHNLRIRS
jgi:hypothetical protein